MPNNDHDDNRKRSVHVHDLGIIMLDFLPCLALAYDGSCTSYEGSVVTGCKVTRLLSCSKSIPFYSFPCLSANLLFSFEATVTVRLAGTGVTGNINEKKYGT